LRRARYTKFRRIGEVLPKVVKSLRLTESVAAQPAVSSWPEMVGAAIARHSRAVSVEKQTLVVVVDSPAWMAQLKYLMPDLLRRIDARVGKGRVKEIRLVPGRARTSAG
jgi:predicted nucleic acid-binding Zn ribbon protein